MLKKPDWIKTTLLAGPKRKFVDNILKDAGLHTVCQEASCPNMCECYSKKTATFLIMGNRCTRNCAFCNVHSGKPLAPDPAEPAKVADAIKKLGLKHAVITSVTRDDLEDGGASCFAQTITLVRKNTPGVIIEVLIPDFKGEEGALVSVLKAGPHVLNHNIETILRLYPQVRPTADYGRSLKLLLRSKSLYPSVNTKSGLMVGMGESEEEVLETLGDLRMSGCDYLTIGQYLTPSREHYPVKEYVHPSIFERYRKRGLEMGFKNVASAPLVRSSYQAEALFIE
ncbi:MAG: lipoyl synthase [Fibrobacteria bacterium]|nr:lipoyl synthase [Fibrobacteria bacterium]